MEVRRFVFVCLALLVGISPTVAAAPQLTILSSTDTEFSFVCHFPAGYSDLMPFVVDDSSVELGHLVQVATPHGARVRVVASEGRGLTAVADSLIRNLAYAAQLVETTPRITVRGRQIVPIRINPLTSAGMFTEVEVHLAFEQGRTTTALVAASDPGFERVFAQAVANWDTARRWPVSDRVQPGATAASRADIGFGDCDRWYRITVNQTALHQITGAQLEAAGISLTGLHSDSLRLFNGGGFPLPVDNAVAAPTFREVAVLVLDGGDGLFGSGDRIVFYGEATNRWRFRADSAAQWVNNAYMSQNIYWLAVGGAFADAPRRIQESDGSLTGGVDTVIASVRQKAHAEQDNLLSHETGGHIQDYYTWFWTDSTRATMYVATPGALAGDSAAIFVAAETDGVGLTSGYVDMTVNGVAVVGKQCNMHRCISTTYALAGGSGSLNQLALSLDSVSVSGAVPPYLNYVEIDYKGSLLPTSNKLLFDAGPFDGRAEFSVIDAFTVTPTVFSLADPLQPVILSGYERSGGYLRFRSELSSADPNVFLLASVTSAVSPVAIAAAAPEDLRMASSQADLIIVAPKQFVSALDEYTSYRRAQGHTIGIVSVEDIMDNFAFGLYDPTAIRNFLKYAYESRPAPAPSAVLFVGDANYDYRGHLATQAPNYVPTYVRAGDWTSGDDNYVYFGSYGVLDGDTSYPRVGDRGFDLITARWPVNSADEIDVVVAKIKTYESASTLGSWRTKVALVADDEYSGDAGGETYHTLQTETLEKQYVPRRFTRDKIYLWEYPFVNRRKPAVNERIVRTLNDGVLLVNYVGHGNPDVWAHEYVFQRASDIPRLNNFTKLPLVYVASCAIGFFDDPGREGMAENLLTYSGGGAIGVISATRLVYSGPNAEFNRDVYSWLFGSDSLTIGEAFFAAKLARQYAWSDTLPRPVENDRAYVFMGDPYLRLGAPSLRVEFTEAPDSLSALGKSHVAGRLVDAQGRPVAADGTLDITVCDSDLRRVHYSGGTAIEYYVGGASIFRGAATVAGGQFAFDFVSPLDVSYGGRAARISVYAVLGAVDGLGVVDSLPVSQTVAPVADSAGPEIAVKIAGRSGVANGAAVTTSDGLVISLTDSSGINLTGGVGHGITLIVDDDEDHAVNLTDLFTYTRDSYTAGDLTYALSDLAAGEHSLKLRAWDNANNVSITTFALSVVDGGVVAIRDLLNYPNPMGDATTFFFDLTAPTRQFSLDIFTLSGRHIWAFRRTNLAADSYPNDEMRIDWDGRDSEGDRVATGVYLYKATAVPLTGETVEQYGKVVVLN